jgi:hypothetical protein
MCKVDLLTVGLAVIVGRTQARERERNFSVRVRSLENRCLVGFPHPSGANGHRHEMNREGLMRSERYLANAEKCQQVANAAYTSGTKRLYGVLASQWRQLAEEADWTDKIGSPALLEKIRHAHTLRQIDKAEGAIREFGAALKGEAIATPKEHHS